MNALHGYIHIGYHYIKFKSIHVLVCYVCVLYGNFSAEYICVCVCRRIFDDARSRISVSHSESYLPSKSIFINEQKNSLNKHDGDGGGDKPKEVCSTNTRKKNENSLSESIMMPFQQHLKLLIHLLTLLVHARINESNKSSQGNPASISDKIKDIPNKLCRERFMLCMRKC